MPYVSKEKILIELKEKGIEIPEDISYQDLQKLYKENKTEEPKEEQEEPKTEELPKIKITENRKVFVVETDRAIKEFRTFEYKGPAKYELERNGKPQVLGGKPVEVGYHFLCIAKDEKEAEELVKRKMF